MVERDPQAVENVRARFGLAQLEFDAAADHLAAEVDEELDDVDQAEHPRAPRHDRQRDDAEGLLQLGVLVEIVQHHLADFAALQLDDDAHAVAIRLVAQVGDAVDRLFAHQLRDALEQAGLVQLIRDLVDDDLLAIAFLRRLDFRLRADLDRAAAGEERFVDAAPPDDLPAGGEVGTRDQPDQFLELLLARVGRRIGTAHQRVLDEPDHAVDHLAEVVRRDVGGHAHRDAGRAVHQEVGIGRRKHRRLGRRLVEVRNEVDRGLVEIFHQAFGECLEPGFRVSIRGGRIAIHRAEVALAVDQGLAHVEVLREADQRVVGRLIAVRMVVADDFADHLRALAIGAVRGEAHLAHRVQHAPMRGLQPVADVRQRPPDDYAHRVIQVRALHLVFDVYGSPINFHSAFLDHQITRSRDH